MVNCLTVGAFLFPGPMFAYKEQTFPSAYVACLFLQCQGDPPGRSRLIFLACNIKVCRVY
jgi:hypothetical protein